jgi:hypothetical protein
VTSLPGYTNPRHLVTQTTTFCAVSPDIFSLIIEAFHLKHKLKKKVYQFKCTKQKAPGNSEAHRIVDPEYEICFMSFFWCLEFGDRSQVFVKSMDL